MDLQLDITKIVDKMTIQMKETEEEFIYETLLPYCENILQLKINKEELKQILLRGARSKGEWIKVFDLDGIVVSRKCSECGLQIRPNISYINYCPNCGSYNGGGRENERLH